MFFAVLALTCAVAVTQAQTPPSNWQKHWFENNQNLRLVSHTPQVAIYYDAAISNNVAWPKTVAEAIWVYTKGVYGSSGSDPRLFVVLHAGKYFGGHPSTYFDSSHDNRNTIDVGLSSWPEGTVANAQGLDVITHEIAHIVELASKGVHESPAFGIWGDSKWAEIYNYDVYRKLGWTADAQRWYNSMIGKSDSFPRANTYWFRDWFFPNYRDHGETAVLNNYFTLLADHFPRNGQSYARRMNMGEFVHFWSGAAKTNLKELALKAFGPNDRNGAGWVAQFDQARNDFASIQYDQAPAATFTVYDGTYHSGASQTYELMSTCNNGLASNFNDRVSSVDGRGACVRLFQHSNCEGTSITLKPNCGADQGCWPNHGDLTGSGLDNGASSSIKC